MPSGRVAFGGGNGVEGGYPLGACELHPPASVASSSTIAAVKERVRLAGADEF